MVFISKKGCWTMSSKSLNTCFGPEYGLQSSWQGQLYHHSCPALLPETSRGQQSLCKDVQSLVTVTWSPEITQIWIMIFYYNNLLSSGWCLSLCAVVLCCGTEGVCLFRVPMSVRFNSTGPQLLALRRRLPPVLYELHSRLPSFQFDNQGLLQLLY